MNVFKTPNIMNKHVVCLKSDWVGKKGPLNPAPIKGEIYQIDGIQENPEGTGNDYYEIKGFDGAWNTKGFRPTDDTFGEVVTEIIENQHIYEEVLN
jgi:hypothetical protein